jgi:predicted GIY-YIG superfamily endonuclease
MMRPRRTGWLVLLIVFAATETTAQRSTNEAGHNRVAQTSLEQTVVAAFQQVRDGWSSDEVLLQDQLYTQFLSACSQTLPERTPEEFAWSLLNLRKAGKLPGKTTRRQAMSSESYRHVAEIAARFMEDRFQANMDRVICSPALRAEFDEITKKMRPDLTAYQLRKGAFGLRKARRLRPELVVRVGDWDRKIETYGLPELMLQTDLLPERPGVYLFRDATGYLYIGESGNLRRRLEQHLDVEAPMSLRQLLVEQGVDVEHVTVEVHSFGRDTKAKEARIRRAYESDLIASRKPRFNLRP